MNNSNETRPRRRLSRSEREAVLAEYKRSDLSQARFCEEKGISPSTLQNWIRKSRGPEESVKLPTLVPVRLQPSVHHVEAAEPDRCYEISLCSRRRLSVPPGFDPEEVRTLVKILEE